ncbi:hypothetical protein ACFE04_014040 [Oxalis oulophora]
MPNTTHICIGSVPACHRLHVVLNEFRKHPTIHPHDDQLCKSVGLYLAIMEIFPILGYNQIRKMEIDSVAPQCAVCLTDFVDDDLVRLIKCNHGFHRDYIDPWLVSHVTCPICRLNLAQSD